MNSSKLSVKLCLGEIINLILKLKAPSISSMMMMSMMTIMVNCFREMNDRCKCDESYFQPGPLPHFLKIANYGYNTTWKRSKILNSVKHIKTK